MKTPARVPLVSALLLCLLATACDFSGALNYFSKTSTPASPPSSAAFILSFTLQASKNAILTQDVTSFVNAATNTIVMQLPYNVWNDQLTLLPTVLCSPGATVSSAAALNFRLPQTYTVTAQDGLTTNTYTTSSTLNLASVSNAAQVTSFSILASVNPALSSDIVASLDATNHLVIFQVPQALLTANTLLTPTVALSPYATVNKSGAQNFNLPIHYTVTASDGVTTIDWVTSVTGD